MSARVENCPDDDGAAFVDALARHRRRGCGVLVYGDLSAERKNGLSRKHLGAPDQRRYRVFGLADVPRSVVSERLPPGTTPDDGTVAVVDRASELRGCAAAPVDPGAAPFPPAAGAAALGDAIERLDRANDGFEPASLRVCVDSLSPFVERTPFGEVRTAVRRLSTEVTDRRGLLQAFLPVSADHPAVDALRPLFEVTIEVGRDEATMSVADGDDRRAQAMPLSLLTR